MNLSGMTIIFFHSRNIQRDFSGCDISDEHEEVNSAQGSGQGVRGQGPRVPPAPTPPIPFLLTDYQSSPAAAATKSLPAPGFPGPSGKVGREAVFP